MGSFKNTADLYAEHQCLCEDGGSGKAGLTCYIERKDGHNCCKWCAGLAGRYRYPDEVPKDVYRRHDNCTCDVSYVSEKGRRNVHTQQLNWSKEKNLEYLKQLDAEKKAKRAEYKANGKTLQKVRFKPSDSVARRERIEYAASLPKPMKLTKAEAIAKESEILAQRRLTYDRKRGIIITGGKYTVGSEQWIRHQELRANQASIAYSELLNADNIKAISKSSGLSEEEISRIKDHVFKNKHISYDGTLNKFTPDYDMAVAFKRLERCNPESRDILLLKHELYESQCEEKYKLTASEAHKMANEKYNWQSVIELLNDGEGEADDLL